MTGREKDQQSQENIKNNNGLVAVEIPVYDGSGGGDTAMLFFRRDDQTILKEAKFTPFLLTNNQAFSGDCPVHATIRPLKGTGKLNTLVLFESWSSWKQARSWLAGKTGYSPNAQNAPFLAINDPVQQHMMLSGLTLFAGMSFEQLRRMQVDIETYTAHGFDFCNSDRESDRIITIAMGDNSGWEEALWEPSGNEKRLLERFVERVRERNPDVIEGHNIFRFDLPYISARAARHGVALALGRDGSHIRSGSSRYTAGERIISYPKFTIAGRHIVDTYFLLHAYDLSTRSLHGFGLKEAAAQFNVSAPRRTFIEGSEISTVFDHDPQKILQYALEDIKETRALSGLLSRSAFTQAKKMPFSYQSTCLRGNATKIDALMIREYIKAGRAIPAPEKPKKFQGGYTDIFTQGVVKNVHHCDIRSLYPSIMLSKKIRPASDSLGAFLKLLESLKHLRIEALKKMQEAKDPHTNTHFDSVQAAMKILINSFYGYLGFPYGRFNDFSAAERVAAEGRVILKNMVEWLLKHNAKLVEIDTDGIYFVPPSFRSAKQRHEFQEALRLSLPEGIEIEFDGEYDAMFSYKIKNYALLDRSGNLIIRGAALKSRGLEPYLRSFLRDLIRAKLESRNDKLPELKNQYEKAVAKGKTDIRQLAKTETLKDTPNAYAEKIAKGKRGKNAAYELALRSGRPYQAGDQISYYIIGSGKNVSAYRSAKLVSDWDPASRDENTDYYLAKLDLLYQRLA